MTLLQTGLEYPLEEAPRIVSMGGAGAYSLVATGPNYADAVRLGCSALRDFAFATGGFRHDPAWVGPEQERAFHVRRRVNDGEVEEVFATAHAGDATGGVEVAPVRVRGAEVAPVRVGAGGLRRRLVTSLWPSWAVVYSRVACGREQDRGARRAEVRRQVRREEVGRVLEEVARSPRRGVDDLFDGLG